MSKPAFLHQQSGPHTGPPLRNGCDHPADPLLAHRPFRIGLIILALLAITTPLAAQRTHKPVLHGRHWMAITGKPLAATAGARMFIQGGNAVDAAAAMLAATCTMWDVLSWGGETQALIYNPNTRQVVAINALGVAPTGATAEFFASRGLRFPPEFGPLAAVTPGTPGGLFTMLAEYGTMSLAEVLQPAIEMADGYPIEAEAVSRIAANREWLERWRYSRALFLGDDGQPPAPGEIFRQPELAATLRSLVEAERQALAAGAGRKAAIQAAYDRFYRGDIARELVRGIQEEGGLVTLEDLAGWSVRIEEPVSTEYRGITVFKLQPWTQGPAMLQALNILETFDLQAMGYNSARYIHALYQAMSLAFADRDFYYGDPLFPPEEPIRGLLSKEYARQRAAQIGWERNDARIAPGDPYPFQDGTNPFREYLARWGEPASERRRPGATPRATTPGSFGAPGDSVGPQSGVAPRPEDADRAWADFVADFTVGTTTIQAADSAGWVVSVTPSGGWIPAVIAGRTGIGLSQRMQSFVTDPADGPFNVVEPGKRPRVTLTPMLALRDGEPFLSAAVQGGDTQDQNLLQFFLNVVEFGMNVQQAAEAANFNSYQMRGSFGEHESYPGRLLLNESVPPWVRTELARMGYDLRFAPRTSGPINAIYFDREHGTMWGGSSDFGEDYGIGW